MSQNQTVNQEYCKIVLNTFVCVYSLQGQPPTQNACLFIPQKQVMFEKNDIYIFLIETNEVPEEIFRKIPAVVTVRYSVNIPILTPSDTERSSRLFPHTR